MTVIRNQEGQSLQVLSDMIHLKLRSEHSSSNMAVVIVEAPPGSIVPPHIHTREEESYYMLEGTMSLHLDGQDYTIEPNDFVHIPPGTVHGYQNQSDRPLRFLVWTVGGALDHFFLELSNSIQQIPEDLPKLPEILMKYGIQTA